MKGSRKERRKRIIAGVIAILIAVLMLAGVLIPLAVR